MHLSIWGHHQSCRHQHRHHIGLSGHDHVLPLGLILRDQLSLSPTWFWPGSCIDIGIDGSWTDITSHLEQKHQNLSVKLRLRENSANHLWIKNFWRKMIESPTPWWSLRQVSPRNTTKGIGLYSLSLSELGMAGEHTTQKSMMQRNPGTEIKSAALTCCILVLTLQSSLHDMLWQETECIASLHKCCCNATDIG